MTRIKVRVKQGSKGKPLGERVAEMRAEQGREQRGDKVLYRPKARLNVHIHDGR